MTSPGVAVYSAVVAVLFGAGFVLAAAVLCPRAVALPRTLVLIGLWLAAALLTTRGAAGCWTRSCARRGRRRAGSPV